MAERFFNTSGPVVAEDHYCIPPLGRLELDEILRLIDAKRYFVLHAPRQTGKTSALLALRDLLNERGAYRCVYTNVEPGQTARGDVAAGMRVLLAELSEEALIALGDGFLDQTWERTLARAGPHGALRQTLRRWCLNDPKPLVLLIDEIDTLVGDTLISVLRQLRAGYVNRPAAFPQSVVLCGVRDVRDYPIHSESAGGIEREYALGRRRTDLLIVWPPVRPGGAADPGRPRAATWWSARSCARAWRRRSAGVWSRPWPTWTGVAATPPTWWSSTATSRSRGRRSSTGARSPSTAAP